MVVLSGVVEPARTHHPPRSPLRELQEGAEFVRMSPLLRPVLITAVFFNVGWFILQAAYVPYAMRVLRLTAAETGATMAIYGAGMLAGALLAPQVTRRLRFGTVIRLGPLGGMAGALLLLLTLRWPTPVLAGASFFLFGLGPVLWVISSTTLRQAITPPHMLGRVGSLVMMATYGARPLGAAVGALVGARLGEEACLVASAVAFAVQLGVICMSAVARLAELPAEARDVHHASAALA
ncbi:MAG: transporter, partial [Myxococcaceae bacterium]|nr:transporter [Myxococcaceae bacterium]